MNSIKRLLIIGNPDEYHVGAHFFLAAKQLGLEPRLVDIRESHSKNVWVNRFFFRLGKRPAHLKRFSRKVITVCREQKPQALLVTGISSPVHQALKEIGRMGIRRANYLTDDPWNPANGAKFFWSALRAYDVVFSPRRANLEDLRRHGCGRVDYLPFGYNPELHFPEYPENAQEWKRFECDVSIVGGADADRIPIALALARAGLHIKLYGGYWNRHEELAPHWQGFAYGRDLRLAVSAARVNVCMGRKANRDGHAMRSLELPAMRACMVVEHTLEHRELFGEDGDCVMYYSNFPDLVNNTKALCCHAERARALGGKVYQRICCNAKHTYADRLQRILRVVEVYPHD